MPTLDPRQVAALWYREIDRAAALSQGDQFWDLELLDARAEPDGSIGVDRLHANLIILTQSCDLEHDKTSSVLTSPMYALDDWLCTNPADLSRLEDIRRGYDSSLYLLPAWRDARCNAARTDRLIDLNQLRVVPIEILRSASEAGTDRISLSSPAREHFSQAVARTFMRVGLPADIPSFDLRRQGGEQIVIQEISAGDAPIRLSKPLHVARRCYIRSATGDQYWLVTSKGHNPSLLGVGSSERQAIESLGMQLGHARLKLFSGDTAWSWLSEYLPAEGNRP